MTDNVNHPKHYTQGVVECIDALAAATINLKGLDAVCTANAIKYLWRWGHKNGVENLKKARWYIDKLVKENEVVEDKNQDEQNPSFITAVRLNLNMWCDSGDVDYLHKAIAAIRSKIEEDGVEDLVGIKVAPGNGVRVAKAVWNKENGKVYCDCCKESTLRYYNFCPNCGCYLLRDDERKDK